MDLTMIRPTLLFTFALLLNACSDNTPKNQPATANTPEKEVVIEQKKAVAPEPIKENPVVVQKEEPTISGHTFYAHKCASCHGKNGEKAAFNNAQVIAGWDKAKSIAALNGYKDGTYGGSLKGIMKGQVSALSDAQIEAVSEYISTL